MTTTVNPRWIQFLCAECHRILSDCRPAGSLNIEQPRIEYIHSCAMCAKKHPRN